LKKNYFCGKCHGGRMMEAEEWGVTDCKLCVAKRIRESSSKGKVIPAHIIEAYREGEGTAPFILNLGKGWR
jgi:hypothetical protein